MSDDKTEVTPVAPEQSKQEAAKVDVEKTEAVEAVAPLDGNNERIRDEFAYWKAQAEKNQRLLAKEQAAKDSAKEQLSTFQKEQAQEVNSKIEKLQGELDEQTLAASTAQLEAAKVKALVDAGLDTEMMEFITESDPEKINAQVSKLAGKIGTRSTKLGNTANNTGIDLSWHPNHPSYNSGGFGE